MFVGPNVGAQGRHNELRRVVPFGGQALNSKALPTIGLCYVHDFTRQSTASQEQNLGLGWLQLKKLRWFEINITLRHGISFNPLLVSYARVDVKWPSNVKTTSKPR